MVDGNLMEAWGGICSVGLGLSLIWTEGRKRGLGIGSVVKLVCERTAEHGGLGSSKGRLEKGFDGDVVIFDPDAKWKVRSLMSLFERQWFRCADYSEDRSIRMCCFIRIS
jgi:allantoinase